MFNHKSGDTTAILTASVPGIKISGPSNLPNKKMSVSIHPGTERMNAHDLFSCYTADIIKKDVVFTR